MNFYLIFLITKEEKLIKINDENMKKYLKILHVHNLS